jgi:ADP-ribose pyrophosphatase YjhB (NUDIX family)
MDNHRTQKANNMMILKRISILFLLGTIYLHSIELRQPFSDVPTLTEEAEKTQERLIAFLNNVERKRIVIDPGIKGQKTIDQLLQTRWNGDASRITDYARATLGVDTIKDVYDCINAFKQSSLEIVAITDNFVNPTPENYRDINIVFKDEVNSMLGEVQINIMHLITYKNSEGHDLFDEIRNLKANAKIERRELTNEEQALLHYLTERSRKGYDTAFDESLLLDGKKIRIGVYAVVMQNDKILLTTTKAGSQTILNLPGGGVDQGEGFAAALKRECLEELGCEVEIGEMLYTSETLYVNPEFPDSYMFHLYFKVTLKGTIDTVIHDSKWFKLSSLPLEDMLPIDQEFFQHNPIQT